MVRFDNTASLSPVRKSSLSLGLSTILYRPEVLLLSQFMNIVLIPMLIWVNYRFDLLHTVNTQFAEFNQFTKFSEALPAFRCASIAAFVLGVIFWFLFLELIFFLVSLLIKFHLQILILMLFHKILVKMIDWFFWLI